MGFYEEAKAKLEKGVKQKHSWYGEIMKQGVADALLTCCRQEPEFAQAIAQGGSFADCIKEIEKHIKDHAITDFKAYGIAVGFYFPGAALKCSFEIDLCASVRPCENEPKKKAVVLDLSEFF